MRKLKIEYMLGGLGLTLLLGACGKHAVPQPQQPLPGHASSSPTSNNQSTATTDLPPADPALVSAVPDAQARADFLGALSILPVAARSEATLINMDDAKAYPASASVQGAGRLIFRNLR